MLDLRRRVQLVEPGGRIVAGHRVTVANVSAVDAVDVPDELVLRDPQLVVEASDQKRMHLGGGDYVDCRDGNGRQHEHHHD